MPPSRPPLPPLPPLLAVAHGSSEPAAADVAATVVAASGLDARLAFLDHGGPRPVEVLAGYAAEGATEVVVLPLLLSHAGHAREDIASLSFPGLRLIHGRALGPHPLLAAVVRDRLAAAGVPASASVLVASAGTRDQVANAAVTALAAALVDDGLCVAAAAGFASLTSPTVPEAVATLSGPVAMVPYFLSWGRLPRAAVAASGATWVAEPLGPDPRLGEVLAERYREAMAAGG